MNIVVLHDDVAPDARKDELDCLTQAAVVSETLRGLGHEVTCLPCPLDLPKVRDELARRRPDRVFNLVESIAGQGRLIHLAPSLLDSLRLSYTGAPAEAMFLTSNKLTAKKLLQARNIPTAPWFTAECLGTTTNVPPGRYILKSVWEHASVGLGDDAVIHVYDPAALRQELLGRAHRLGGEAFAEAYIHGREFNIALLGRGPDGGPQVLPHAEIIFEGYAEDRPKLVDYRAKWDEDSYEYHHTPRRYDFPRTDAPLLRELSGLALDCWKLFGLRGYARVDFRIDAEGRPFVLEINANPCLSPDAGYAAALQQARIPFSEAIDRIVHDVPA